MYCGDFITKIESNYVVHLKLIQRYMLIIPQLEKNKEHYSDDYWSYIFSDLHKKSLRLNS